MSEHRVPRIIHQTWKTTSVSARLARCIRSFRILNPDWEFRFYTDEDAGRYVTDCGKKMHDAYLRLPPGIMRADFFRVLALLREGGVYADIDVECLRGLTSLLDQCRAPEELWLSRDHPIHERCHYKSRAMLMNDFMLAVPGSRFLGEVADWIVHRSMTPVKAADAVQITGPGLFSSVAEFLGGPQAACVGLLDTTLVHALPDMNISFDEKPDYERIILSRSWRRYPDPIVVHYWHHTWCTEANTLTKYGSYLQSTDAQLLDAAAADCELSEAAAILAESLCTALVMGIQRVSCPADAEAQPAATELQRLVERLGLGWSWGGLDPASAPTTAEAVVLPRRADDPALEASLAQIEATFSPLATTVVLILDPAEPAENPALPGRFGWAAFGSGNRIWRKTFAGVPESARTRHVAFPEEDGPEGVGWQRAFPRFANSGPPPELADFLWLCSAVRGGAGSAGSRNEWSGQETGPWSNSQWSVSSGCRPLVVTQRMDDFWSGLEEHAVEWWLDHDRFNAPAFLADRIHQFVRMGREPLHVIA